jgi:hypothetical protein
MRYKMIDKAAPKRNPKAGAWTLAARQDAALQNFRDYLLSKVPMSKTVLDRVVAYYLKHRLIRLDPHVGQFHAKHGAYLDKEAIKACIDITTP